MFPLARFEQSVWQIYYRHNAGFVHLVLGDTIKRAAADLRQAPGRAARAVSGLLVAPVNRSSISASTRASVAATHVEAAVGRIHGIGTSVSTNHAQGSPGSSDTNNGHSYDGSLMSAAASPTSGSAGPMSLLADRNSGRLALDRNSPLQLAARSRPTLHHIAPGNRGNTRVPIWSGAGPMASTGTRRVRLLSGTSSM